MKRKSPIALAKSMKAVKKKKEHYDSDRAIEKKLAEIKKDSKKSVPAYNIPSLFRYAR